MNSSPTRLVLLVATRKGAWLFHGDGQRRRLDGRRPALPGPHHQPRACSTRATAARCWPRPRPATSGRPIFRSTDLGRTWKEAQQPPAFAKPPNGLPARSVDHTFWLTPGHASERDTWYAGTSPQGLFRSEDGGVSWAPLPAVNDDPQFREWMGTAQDGTPDGPKLHSHHRRPARPGAPLLRDVGRRRARVARRAARSWSPLIEGMEVVEGFDASDRHLPRPALRAPVPEQARPPVPAEPLRHLPARPRRATTWQRIGRKHAEARGRHRLSDGGAPARRRHGLGLPDGRHRRLAAHQPGRQPGGLRHAQRRPDLAAAGPGPAREPGLVDREAPGDDGRRAADRRRCTSAPPAASCGSAATRARAGSTSRATCRRSTRSKCRRGPA